VRRLLASPRFRCAAILIGCFGGAIAALGLSAASLDSAAVCADWQIDDDLFVNVELRDVSDVAALTDRGRPVLLRTNVDPSASRLEAALLRRQAALLAHEGLQDQVIHIARGWKNCNCHGFVFADGRYWVSDSKVDMILEDNGYRLVSEPRSGDVAVYRGGQNKVCHTGVVRYVSPESGTILVESKWGGMGLFIHPHNVHCFGTNDCTFYRSDRAGHRLMGIPEFGARVPSSAAPGYAVIPSL
jgi:hypothetical protein